MNKYAQVEKGRRRKKRQEDGLYWKKDPQWRLWFQDYDDERFREVPGYHGFYFVSDYGKVISFTRKEPRELKQGFNKGVVTVVLSLDGKSKPHHLHELVYRCFGGHIPPGAEVEHLNGDTRDNRLKNLECGREKPDPVRPRNLDGRRPGMQAGKRGPGAREADKGREVLQFDLHGNFLKKYPSAKAASRELNLNTSGIRQCVRGIRETSGGYQWFLLKDPRFKDGIRNVEPTEGRDKKVFQFSLKGKHLRTFSSVSEAVRETGINRWDIDDNLYGRRTSAGNCQFRFASGPEFRFGVKDISPVAAKPKENLRKRKVLQFDLYGRFIAEFESISEASRVLNTSPNNISAVLGGGTISAGGFQWRYRDEPRFRGGIGSIEPVKRITGHMARSVLQFDNRGRYIASFKNAAEAGEAVGRSRELILYCVYGRTLTCGGFQWRFSSASMFKDGIRDISPVRNIVNPAAKRVLKYNRMGRHVETFPSITAAGRDIGVRIETMRRYIEKGHPDETYEFYWEYEEKQ